MNKTAAKGFAVVFSGHNSTARELGSKKRVEHLHAMLCCHKEHFLGFRQHVCVPIPATGTEEVAHMFCFDQIRLQAALAEKNPDCFSEPWKMSESSATTATLSMLQKSNVPPAGDAVVDGWPPAAIEAPAEEDDKKRRLRRRRLASL